MENAAGDENSENGDEPPDDVLTLEERLDNERVEESDVRAYSLKDIVAIEIETKDDSESESMYGLSQPNYYVPPQNADIEETYTEVGEVGEEDITEQNSVVEETDYNPIQDYVEETTPLFVLTGKLWN